MQLELEQKTAKWLESNDLLSHKSKLLLAVSGGADSIALLYSIHSLIEHNIINFELHCAHINHLIRAGQADEDEHFAAEQAAKLNLDITTVKVNVPEYAARCKLSIETAARKLRLESLIKIAEDNHCDCIATGHHQDDNAETVIHHLLRGTGYRGLAGIWPSRQFDGITFIRPMLCVTRCEIIEYLKRRNLAWREDSTNTDCRYTRNLIRHKLLPHLQHTSRDSLTQSLSKLSESAYQFIRLICTRADEIWPKATDYCNERLILNTQVFMNLPLPVQVEILSRCFDKIGTGRKDITQRHYQRIFRLAGQNISDKRIELPGGFIVRRQYGNLLFSKQSNIQPAVSSSNQSVTVPIPGRVRFRDYEIETGIIESFDHKEFLHNTNRTIECFDLDKIRLPLTVRSRRQGDKFIPLGRKGDIRLGKFLTAQKVPYEIRKRILIVSDKDKIIWLWPVRISEQVRITDKTNRILQLKIVHT